VTQQRTSFKTFFTPRDPALTLKSVSTPTSSQNPTVPKTSVFSCHCTHSFLLMESSFKHCLFSGKQASTLWCVILVMIAAVSSTKGVGVELCHSLHARLHLWLTNSYPIPPSRPPFPRSSGLRSTSELFREFGVSKCTC
jgi:hypothetical protein